MNQIKQGYKQTKVGIIPEDWKVVKLSEVLKEKPKYGIGASAEEFSTKLPTYLRITDIDNGKFKPNKKASVSDKEYINYILKENDLVFARTGATVGKSYIYNPNDGELVYAGFLIKISPDISKLNSVFFKNFVDSFYYWKWVQLMSMRSGQPGINAEEYSSMTIPLPPLKEQEKIAEILTTWDEAISKQTELLEAKELLKIALMQKLLSGEVRFSGFSDEWEEVRLSKIIKLQGGYAFKSEEFKKKGIPIIRISNISNNSNYMEMNDLIYYDELSNESNFLIKKNDLLIAMSGATTGKVSIYNLEKKAYLNQRVGLFKVIKPTLINYSFLIQFVFSNFFSVQLKSLLVAGAQPNISSKDIESLKIKLPSLPEQQKIAEVLSLVDDEINLLKNELEELKLQKKALMQKLLTGEVRVKI